MWCVLFGVGRVRGAAQVLRIASTGGGLRGEEGAEGPTLRFLELRQQRPAP